MIVEKKLEGEYGLSIVVAVGGDLLLSVSLRSIVLIVRSGYDERNGFPKRVAG